MTKRRTDMERTDIRMRRGGTEMEPRKGMERTDIPMRRGSCGKKLRHCGLAMNLNLNLNLDLVLVLVLALVPVLVSPLSALAQNVTASDSEAINLTIYNQNFALVKDVRSLQLREGVNFLRLEDVAAKIDPTSVSFASLTAPNAVVVREQNYQYDVLNPTTILSKSIGKQVKFKQFLAHGHVNEVSGTLLNAPLATVSDTEGNTSVSSQGLVLKTSGGIVLDPQGQAEIQELPAGLISKPSLLWKLETTKSGQHKAEIAYQTRDVNWRADYVAVANSDDTKSDITSWVTLDNKSGASYKGASLKLLAGDVHRVQPVPQSAPMAMDTAVDGAPPPQFQEQAFAEYHLYTLQGKTDVNDNEIKQLSLFNANDVPVSKMFVFEADTARPFEGDGETAKQKVAVKLELTNSEENHLGMPMPKGKVRVYKKDADGALQFIGEDQIDHTPRDEKIRLYIGDAFDVVAERTQTNMEQVSNRVQRMSYAISLRNHKKTPIKVLVVEHAWGDWKIIDPSQAYKKKESRTFEFNVDVPASQEAKVTYTIEIRS